VPNRASAIHPGTVHAAYTGELQMEATSLNLSADMRQIEKLLHRTRCVKMTSVIAFAAKMLQRGRTSGIH
jgi:hypothetical protein